ncbi:protein WVD2-like 7 [Bidens hawaiensis]|uniref:protein WVD2-like 7 n=1 Tax=Bidens hawaiensis TaxID=980011 RepID=UPI004049E10F
MGHMFRVDQKADLLHSGSISFGRFESESLSWERRSIFSHNKYLEEVEKCSKPGSVTEKKAYFEAEFRRKALLKQRSSECQDGVESARNNDPHGYEEYGDCNESPCSYNPSECNTETESQHHEKVDVCFDEDTVTQHWETQSCEFHPQDVLGETHQSENDNVAGNTEQSIGLTVVDHVVPVDVPSEAKDESSLVCQTTKKDHDSICSAPQTAFSPKVKPEAEKKLVKSTLKTRVNVDNSQKMVLNGTSKGSMKPRASESKVLPVKKTEKKSPQPASPLIGSRVKTLKAEELRAEKEVKVKAQLPLPQKSLPGVRQTINRSKQTVNPTRTHMVQSATDFGFKTGQRAENRKEFYTKIVEKTHAKEMEINKFEAKTLEKQVAEMKQFRKSLNFKAKPLPSFYIDQPKVTPITKTTNQPRPRSQAMATRPIKSSVPLNARPSSSTTSTNRIRVPESVGRNNVAEKKDTKSSKPKDPIPRRRDMMKRNVKGVHTWNGPKAGVVS